MDHCWYLYGCVLVWCQVTFGSDMIHDVMDAALFSLSIYLHLVVSILSHGSLSSSSIASHPKVVLELGSVA